MNKKTMKILTTIVTIMMMISIGTSVVYAAATTTSGAIDPKNLTATYNGTSQIQTVGRKHNGNLEHNWCCYCGCYTNGTWYKIHDGVCRGKG